MGLNEAPFVGASSCVTGGMNPRSPGRIRTEGNRPMKPGIPRALPFVVLMALTLAGCASKGEPHSGKSGKNYAGTQAEPAPPGAAPPGVVAQAPASEGPEEPLAIRFKGGGVPVFPEAVLADGLIAARMENRLTFYDRSGRQLAEAAIQQRLGEPVEVLGFAPGGDRFFYTQDAMVSGTPDADPTLPKLRALDFRKGSDEVVLSVPNHIPLELAFNPTGPGMLVNLLSGEGSPSKLWKDDGEGFREVRPQHPVIQAGALFGDFSFNPDGTRVFFGASYYVGTGGPVRKGDEVFAMAPDGRDVRTISLGMPGFLCGKPLHSPVEAELAVTCWRLGERPATANLYLVTLDGEENVLAVKQLTDLGKGGMAYPVLWSGDGRHLVANNWRGCDRDIFFIDVETGAVKNVTADKETRYGSRLHWAAGARNGAGNGAGKMIHVVRTMYCNPGDRSVFGELVKLDLATGEEDVVLSGVEQVWVTPGR